MKTIEPILERRFGDILYGFLNEVLANGIVVNGSVCWQVVEAELVRSRVRPTQAN